MSRGGVQDNSTLNEIVGKSDISNVANTVTQAIGNEELLTKSKTLSGAINENTADISGVTTQILAKCEEIKNAVDAISGASLPNPLSLQINGNISQTINYPFGTGTMSANATCTFPLSAFWTLGYKECSVNGKEYDTSTASVSLSMGSCQKSDGLVGSTGGNQSNTLVFRK